MVKPGQATLEDSFALIRAQKVVRDLSPTDLNVISFLEQGFYQAMIARALKVSRATVNRTVTKLESEGLIVPKRITLTHKGKKTTLALSDPLGNKATTYTVTDRLKRLLEQDKVQNGTYHPCSVHNVRIKFPIQAMEGALNRERPQNHKMRSTFIKSWDPHGPTRHLWQVYTREAIVGIEVHPKQIVGYRVSRDDVMVRNEQEALAVVSMQIRNGLDIWLREQSLNGCKLRVGQGELRSKPHYAWPGNKGGPWKEDTGRKVTSPLGGEIWVDKSLEEHDMPGLLEVETNSQATGTAIDNLAQALRPGAIKKEVTGALEPLAAELSSFTTHMQGQANQAQMLEAERTFFMSLTTRMMNRLDELEKVVKNGNDVPHQDSSMPVPPSEPDHLYR